MQLMEYITETYGVPSEDQKGLEEILKDNKELATRALYKKDPPYLMEPYINSVERWTRRYNEMGSGNEGKWYGRVS